MKHLPQGEDRKPSTLIGAFSFAAKSNPVGPLVHLIHFNFIFY
jgi:hypothetical protein